MQKWEYLRIDYVFAYGGQYIPAKFSLYSNGDLLAESETEETIKVYDHINKLGRDGWEMISTSAWGDLYAEHNSYQFKRPVE